MGKFSSLELSLFLVDFLVKDTTFKGDSLFLVVWFHVCLITNEYFYEMPNQLCFLILVSACFVECFSFKTHEFTVGSSP